MRWIKVGKDGTTADSDMHDSFSLVNPVSEAYVELDNTTVSIISNSEITITCSKRFDQSATGTRFLGYVIRLYSDEPEEFTTYLAGQCALFIGPSLDEPINTENAIAPVEVKEFTAGPTSPIEIYLNENNISRITGA